MDLGNTLFTLGIIILLVALIAMVIVFQGYLSAKYDLPGRATGRPKKKSTTFLDEGEDEKKCEICYGKINEDPIAKCACGRIFHEACAKPTGSCPYCGTSYENMEVREPERTRCPVCGKFLKGSICSCGAVIRRKDDTFVCKCGNFVDAGKPVCKKCGAVYERTIMKVFKEKK
ncbi:MAG: hypothetical protein LBP82_02000 [Candidatus Methanoplasma sp.]|jgi:hypothetical protein|nr:hypothetical protein [Candidatus Methanoplasma sp.]